MAALGITHESVRGMLAESHRGWLCEADSQVVGFAIGDGQTGETWVIAVLKEIEGRGVGERLLGLVEEWLFSRESREISLTTDPDETIRAVVFCRHQGWTDWKIEPGGDRSMTKALTP